VAGAVGTAPKLAAEGELGQFEVLRGEEAHVVQDLGGAVED
jgi:hypothetical protein